MYVDSVQHLPLPLDKTLLSKQRRLSQGEVDEKQASENYNLVPILNQRNRRNQTHLNM
jgi:hypothetical protein